MENASDSCGPSTVLPMNLVALTPVCSVPKLHASPENMRCLERSFSTIALHARNHLRSMDLTCRAFSPYDLFKCDV